MRSIGRHTRAYQTQDLFDTYDDSDPFLFHQRIVLRSQGLIPLKKLVKLHRLHKEVTRIASHHWAIMLGVMNRHIPSDPCDDPDTPSKLLPDELRARVRVMERTFHEQNLRMTAQTLGLVHTDLPGLRLRAQQLFGEAYEERGMPNAAEAHLLARKGRVRVANVNKWFMDRNERFKPFVFGSLWTWYFGKLEHAV
ncbi:hypothetical protein MMC19_001360 [Ptychographa xylographoides]|nr:hypothetical protein [Ptychographa xylographoides]